MHPEDSISRRRVLEGAAAAGVVGAVGSVGAAARPERRIVGVDSAAAEGLAREQAAAVDRTLDFGDVGRAIVGRFPDQAVATLREHADVSYVERDGEVRAHAQSLEWGADRIDADVAHANGETGAGSDVAIIDTGIDSDHPDLQANLGQGKAFVSCSGSGCNEPWDDDNDHGTHVAGIAGAVDNSQGVVGVAPETTLHAVKVLNDWGSGSLSDVAAGIQWVADQGYDVANLSIGTSSSSSTLKNAVEYAHDRGVLLVASAGGSGPCSNCVAYPAAYPEVIAVGATDCNDDLASFSSQGSSLGLVAPGVDIESTVVGGYSTYSGTSMSTAYVAGAGAQLAAQGFTNAGARSQLQSTAENLGLSSSKQGHGLVDVASALGLPSTDDGGC